VTRGREAIRQLYVSRLAAIAQVVSGALKSDGSAPADATLVYEWGHATLAVTKRDGGRAESAGAYLTVWRRNPAGRWEIIRNIVL
jgi:ketosteroid isomerase-like protein